MSCWESEGRPWRNSMYSISARDSLSPILRQMLFHFLLFRQHVIREIVFSRNLKLEERAKIFFGASLTEASKAIPAELKH